MRMNSYEIRELVGEGSFGKVYKARIRSSDDFVAYKIICKAGRRFSEVQALRKECEIQKNLQHPNIIRMLDSFETNEALVVVTEFALKDLCQILKEEGVLPEIRAKKITIDLVSALHYLHSNRILHRDLKPPNVLIDSSDTAKLCDFGFAKVLKNDSSVLTSIKGTPLYMAPELVNESPYDHTADLWSLGCITYQLVTGRPPYTTSSILHLIKMIKLEPIKWPNYLSDACLSFLKGLLHKNPQCRLSWPYLQYHPFINFESTTTLTDCFSGIDSTITHQNNNASPSFPLLPFNSSSMNCYLGKVEFTEVPQISTRDKAYFSEKIHIPSGRNYLNEVKEHKCDKKCENDSEDMESKVQTEEWLEFLRQTIQNVILGDVDALIEKHSLKLVINAFHTCLTCPVVVTTVARLLSLPFVTESVSEKKKSLIRETYEECEIIKDLLIVMKYIATDKLHGKKIDVCHEVALQQLFLLLRYLTFTQQTLLMQFFQSCISLNFLSVIKIYLRIRAKSDHLSIADYVIAIFLLLYTRIPESRQLISTAFGDCASEFHSILQESEGTSVHLKLCTFITVLGCTQPNFFQKFDMIQSLIQDLIKLKSRSNSTSVLQIEAALVVLKKIEHKA